MFRKARGMVRYTATFAILIGATIMGIAIWEHYLTGPWTRDGQVLAYVVNLAPEVSGRIVTLNVRDNQVVRQGDVLYEIDPTDYLMNLANTQANLNSTLSDLQNKQVQSTRRADLTTPSTSQEEKASYRNTASMAAAAYGSAVTQLNQARVNLERTKVLSRSTATSPTCSFNGATMRRSARATCRCWTATASGSPATSRRPRLDGSSPVPRRLPLCWASMIR